MAKTTKISVSSPQCIAIDPTTGDANPHTHHTNRADSVQFTTPTHCLLKFSNDTLFGTTEVPLKKGTNLLKLSDPNPPHELKATYTVEKATDKTLLAQKASRLENKISVAAIPSPHEIVVP